MQTTAMLYILVIVISIITAFILSRLARLSIYARAKQKKRDQFYSKDLNKAISKTLEEVIKDKEKVEVLNEKFAELFEEELQRNIEEEKEKLTFKYEKIIQEKTKSEEIAWAKYKTIASEKKQTEAVIHSIAEGLVVIDQEGKVIMMNPAAEKLLGVKKEEKLKKPLVENIKDEQLVSLIKTSFDSKEKEIELLSANEETKKILKASTAVVENEDGRTVGIVSVLSDITKQKELEELKSKFISNITHELRTPLVAMDKALLLLISSKDNLSEKDKELLLIIQRNLKRLTNFINDILDFSRFEAKSVKLQIQPVFISEIIEEVINTFKSWADTKSINIVKNLEDNLPKVNVDPQRIMQVFNNLINNALKFTKTGGTITIEAKLNKEKNLMEISIKDTGIGIPKEELSKIFDKFYQVSYGSSEISGSGLGLSIVKEIITLHNGNIWAESEGIGKGAKFIFTLPLS